MQHHSTGRIYLYANLALLLAAALWGCAFAAQRSAMQVMGPFFFNGCRFLLGAAVLMGYLRLRGRPLLSKGRGEVGAGLFLALLLFIGASAQQIGIVYTSAGKAGFITGIYVVLIPIALAVFWRERTQPLVWFGALIACTGLFLLSIQGDFTLALGDSWELLCAFVFAFHVIYVGQFVQRYDPLQLAVIQDIICGALSLTVALFIEPVSLSQLQLAWWELLYTGCVSIAIAYSIQLVAQRHTMASHAAIIMSSEAVFAALSGWWILGEALTGQQLVGAGLMLAGMVLAQIRTPQVTVCHEPIGGI